ncbi:MAG: hypothetical protein ACP5QP_03765 [Brevinematia bacterium]
MVELKKILEELKFIASRSIFEILRFRIETVFAVFLFLVLAAFSKVLHAFLILIFISGFVYYFYRGYNTMQDEKEKQDEKGGDEK